MSSKAELGAQQIALIQRRGINFVGGVKGLALNVTMYGSRSWVLRYRLGGRRRDLGLGAYPSVSLSDAREAARRARSLLAQGIDPVANAQATRAKLRAELNAHHLKFSEAAEIYINSQQPIWRNTKHVQQWRTTLHTYAFPVMGQLPLNEITQAHVLQVLEPIWKDKTETASRVRGRIESVIDWAIAKGHRTASNPARWKGLLDKILPPPGKISKTDHHKAIAYVQLPAFMQQLQTQESTGGIALQLLILTATRSGEIRGARWDEFDLTEGIWTIPAERMKAKKEHRIPLSLPALNLLNRQKQNAQDQRKTAAVSPFVFPSLNRSCAHKPISDMTLTGVMRRMGTDAVPHGFRSTFRDWSAEMTDYPNEVAEMALAHAIGNKVEAAYRRGDLFIKRQRLMQDWANYATNQFNLTEEK